MSIFLSGAFSLQMLHPQYRTGKGATCLRVRPITDPVTWLLAEEARQGLAALPIINVTEVANVVADILGREVRPNRMSVSLNATDVLLVGQVVGGRLPQGTQRLPTGYAIEWLVVTIEEDTCET